MIFKDLGIMPPKLPPEIRLGLNLLPQGNYTIDENSRPSVTDSEAILPVIGPNGDHTTICMPFLQITSDGPRFSQAVWQKMHILPGDDVLMRRDNIYLSVQDGGLAVVGIKSDLSDLVANVRFQAVLKIQEPARESFLNDYFDLVWDGNLQDYAPDLPPIAVERKWILDSQSVAHPDDPLEQFMAFLTVVKGEIDHQPSTQLIYKLRNSFEPQIGFQRMEILHRNQDNTYELTRSAAVVLIKDVLLASKLGDRTLIYTPIAVTEYDVTGDPVGIQEGVTMDALALHEAAEQIRKVLNDSRFHAQIRPPELLGALNDVQYYTWLTEIGEDKYRYISTIHPVTPEEFAEGPKPRQPVRPVGHTLTVSGLATQLETAVQPPPATAPAPIPQVESARRSTPAKAEPVKSAKEKDTRPKIYQELDGNTNNPFEYILNGANGELGLKELVQSALASFKNLPPIQIEGIEIIGGKKPDSITLHTTARVGNFGIQTLNIQVVDDPKDTFGIRIEFKLDFAQKIAIGKQAEAMAKDFPKQLATKNNSHLKKTEITGFRVKDQSFVIVGQPKS